MCKTWIERILVIFQLPRSPHKIHACFIPAREITLFAAMLTSPILEFSFQFIWIYRSSLYSSVIFSESVFFDMKFTSTMFFSLQMFYKSLLHS